MERRRLVIAGFGLCALSSAVRAQDVPALAAALNGRHPAAYYNEAGRLFQAGQRDAAVFIFYLGQLRYRTHLTARPNLPRDRDPAVFASLSETVGRPLNEYAFGDIPALVRTIDAVLAYDRQNPDQFTDPTRFPAESRSIREGMVQMRSQVASGAADIRRQRTANGLPNR